MASGAPYSFDIPQANPISELDDEIQFLESPKSVSNSFETSKQMCHVHNQNALSKQNGLFIPLSVLVGSLLETLCSMIEVNPENSKRLFRVICEQLEKLKVISPVSHLDEFASIRSQYKSLFNKIIQSTTLTLDSRLSLPEKMYDKIPKNYKNLPFSYSRISEASDNVFDIVSRYEEEFEELCELGRGGFGKVYKARNKFDQQEYAIKKICFNDKKLQHKPQQVKKIMREVQSLASLQHPNIVHYNSAWMEHKTENMSDSKFYGDHSCSLSRHSDMFSDAVFNLSSTNANALSWGDYPVDNDYESQINKSNKFWKIGADCDEASNSSHSKYPDKKSENNSAQLHFSPKNLPLIKTDGVARDSKMKRVQSVIITHNGSQHPTIMKMLNFAKGSFGRSHSFNDIDNAYSEKNLPRQTVSGCSCEIILYIQMQICESSLDKWIKERNLKLNSNFLSIADKNISSDIYKQLLCALSYIHDKGILHRDLKPGNIFLKGSRPHVLLGDFGLSRPMLSRNSSTVISPVDDTTITFDDFEEHTSGIGTTSYAAPEQLTHENYSFKADMYSAGIILFELTYGFQSAHEKSDCFKSLKEGQVPPNYLIECRDVAQLVQSLLSSNPNDRPSAEELLKSNVFYSNSFNVSNSLTKKIQELQTENLTLKKHNEIYQLTLIKLGINPDELLEM